MLLQVHVCGPLLTLYFVNIFAQQGKLGYQVEEEVEECTHPYPEPDSSLLKNKVNHKCVVAYLKKKKYEKRETNALILFHDLSSSDWMRVAVVHLVCFLV